MLSAAFPPENQGDLTQAFPASGNKINNWLEASYKPPWAQVAN